MPSTSSISVKIMAFDTRPVTFCLTEFNDTCHAHAFEVSRCPSVLPRSTPWQNHDCAQAPGKASPDRLYGQVVRRIVQGNITDGRSFDQPWPASLAMPIVDRLMAITLVPGYIFISLTFNRLLPMILARPQHRSIRDDQRTIRRKGVAFNLGAYHGRLKSLLILQSAAAGAAEDLYTSPSPS